MKLVRLPAQSLRNIRCSCFIGPPISTYDARQRVVIANSTKSFTTFSRMSAIAAPEINLSAKGEKIPGENFHGRLVPSSPSYFTSSPSFFDNLLALQSLLRKHETLPTVRPDQAPRIAWHSLVQYRNMVGEAVKASKYQKIIRVLQRLNMIHLSLMPPDVKAALDQFKRDINPQLNMARPISIDRFGRALGVGKRKASTARAWVVEGDGQVLVNGKSLTEAFGRLYDRESVIWALKATERIDKYNVWALVQGGGTTGQAEALTLAVAKALLAHEPLLKPALRRGKSLFLCHNFVLPVLFWGGVGYFDTEYPC